ncbi:fluoride efflux transporter FluC [Nocardioides sp. SYSU DS0663]|uniref:fluoride efflux transporter FluC n=1 Tax=Nocardioides sp. SYSU DS0663 TaxID=3416445 RepID=UPI003F4C0084
MTPPGGASARVLAAVAAGGALGASLRWLCGEAIPDGTGLPVTTLAVNVVGTLLLALLPLLPAVRRSAPLAAFAGPGVLGGFTTLSAVSDQTRSMLADGRGGLALGYLLATVGLTVAAAALGSTMVARRLARTAT